MCLSTGIAHFPSIRLASAKEQPAFRYVRMYVRTYMKYLYVLFDFPQIIREGEYYIAEEYTEDEDTEREKQDELKDEDDTNEEDDEEKKAILILEDALIQVHS